jgi:hypothetical protein
VKRRDENPSKEHAMNQKRETNATKTTTLPKSNEKVRVRTGVKAGGLIMNHNKSGVRIRTGVRAGGVSLNHNRTATR